MTSCRGFIVPLIIAIVAVLAAGGVGFYAYEKNSDAEAGKMGALATVSTSSSTAWQTYADTVHGFSISVPSQASVSQDSLGQSITRIPFVSTLAPNNNAAKSVSIIVDPGKCDIISDPIYQVIDETNFTIQPWGDQGNANTWTAGQGYYGERDGDCYQILAQIQGTYSRNVPVQPNYDLTAEQADLESIVSTFKFTSASTSTTAWQTYANSQYDFTFKYPTSLNSGYVSINGQPEVFVSFPSGDNKSIDGNGCYVPSIYSGEPQQAYKPTQMTLNGISFCESDGLNPGAGTLEGYYYFTTLQRGAYITIGYDIGTLNGCGAVEGTSKYAACQTFEQNYDSIVIDPLDQSASTLTFTN